MKASDATRCFSTTRETSILALIYGPWIEFERNGRAIML